ncbi:hypothetical protein [Methylobacterium sp.]|jgi:hypothetical protein|uniref:hypothetical protein n=1 Tax=Methylobacterium sp. TaxID=409 RepID=UPI0025CE1A42|nr:hypothetical protein [Methylobacterium sp.]MBY0256350.1 hypothetical protein [Methylobacterium sp.]
MPHNVKTPAGQGEGFGNTVVASQADNFSLASQPRFYQAKKLAARLGLSLAQASVIAEQAYAIPETWGSRA